MGASQEIATEDSSNSTERENAPGFQRHAASGIHFQSLASVLLGTITGLLIALPLTGNASVAMGTLVLIASGAAGALIGYRRRTSRSFLYLCFAAILILSGTISTALQPQ